MHKSFIAIVLALTLTSAFAAYITSNYEIAPVSVAQDSDYDFTNTSYLSLVSITPGSLHLLSGKITVNTANTSANNWNLFYRQLNTKSLAGTQNNTASIVAPLNVFFYNSYAVGFDVDSTSGASNLWAYQIPLTSGTTFPGRLQLSNNSNPNFTVLNFGVAQIENTVYVAFLAANLTVNITSFTVGASAPDTPFIFSTTFDTPYSLSLAWGEALGSSQLFAVWSENGVLKDAVIDGRKRTVATPTVVPGYNSRKMIGYFAFVTDKKLYGEFCYGFDFVSGSILSWVRTTANDTLIQIANYTANTSSLHYVVPYGPYLAVIFRDTTPTTGVNYAYELWNLENFNTTYLHPRKQYLNIDGNSTQVLFRLGSDGLYTLLYNNKQGNGPLTNVQVGLLLGSSNSAPVPESSYLASVLGFLRAEMRKLIKN